MRIMRIKNLRTGIVYCQQAKLANSFSSRLLGLMFKENLNSGEGLIIAPCNSIHTFFMRFNIDVLFLDKRNRIVKIIRDMPPWRMSWMYWRAQKVIEISGGSLEQGAQEGDQLEVICIS
jgi:uncharacterized membrane protein (UPF0127 family)